MTMAMSRITDDEYMLQNYMIVEEKDDCFYKMHQHLNKLSLKSMTEQG